VSLAVIRTTSAGPGLGSPRCSCTSFLEALTWARLKAVLHRPRTPRVGVHQLTPVREAKAHTAGLNEDLSAVVLRRDQLPRAGGDHARDRCG